MFNWGEKSKLSGIVYSFFKSLPDIGFRSLDYFAGVLTSSGFRSVSLFFLKLGTSVSFFASKDTHLQNNTVSSRIK